MQEFLIREESKLSGYGYKPENRPVELYIRNGVIILDKWPGPTCNTIDDFIKKKLNLGKTAHAGTIDPQVSGTLVITLQNACKLISVLQRVDKEYIGVIHFHKDLKKEQIEKAVREFIGTIKQKPPRISAVSRKIRKRKIHDIKLLDKQGRNACLYVRCEAGTYIRVLFHQLGQELGSGAHMKELRRIKSGNFSENDAVKINEVIDAYEKWKNAVDEKDLRKVVKPLEESVQHLKKIIIKDSAIYSISNGSPLYTKGICKVQSDIKKSDLMALFSLKGELIAVGESSLDAESMLEKNLLAAKIKRVVIDKGIYPKFK